MSISEQQLEIWSNQGAVVKSKETADSVKYALNNYKHFPTSDYTVFLQGSYKNDTNIRGESDVDVVIQLNKTFYNNLNDEEKKILGFSPAEYFYNDFRNDTINALNSYYSQNDIIIHPKCIKIKESDNRLPADVIISCQYRKYFALKENSFVEGVYFFTNDSNNRRIENYPKQVYDNGCEKNKSTNGMFKPVVRIFKNLRRQANTKAPSYFIQCLIFNIPDSCFSNTFNESTYNILKYLSEISDEDLKKFKCQHKQFSLFGDSNEQWDIPSARQFISDIITFWNNYA